MGYSHLECWVRGVAVLVLAAGLGIGATGRAGPQPLPNLEGRWAQKYVQTAIADPPVIGRTTSETISHYITEIRQQGAKLTLWFHACDVAIESDLKLVRTEFPPRFVSSIPQTRRDGTVRRTDDRVEIDVEKATVVLGADLRQKTTEKLPTSPEDSRVVDQDKDGHPGITVKIEGLLNADVYVVQRGWDSFRGTLTEPNRITGPVSWNSEQEVLGSTSMFIRSTPPINPHPNPERSYFEMVRVPDDTKCRDLLRAKTSLFKR